MTGCPFPFPDHAGVAPSPAYADLRDTPAPVRLRGEMPAHLALRHDEVRDVLASPAFSRSAAADLGLTSRSKESLSLNSVDPPDHGRRRKIVAGAFSPGQVAALTPEIERITASLLDGMVARPAPADLVARFALPLTVSVVCGIVGVPVEDTATFHPWVERMMCTTAFGRDEVAAAHAAMHDYFLRLVSDGGDREGCVLYQVASACRSGELEHAEAAHLVSGLLIAGYETTSNQLGMCALLLLTDGALAQRLRDDPDRVPHAVEEMLRVTSLNATGGVPHVAQEAVRVGDRTVAEGEIVVPVGDGANRDPAVFDRPDVLDVDREHVPHLSFGHGRHLCLGAPLARAELRVALTALLGLPGLALAVSERELRWREGMFIRGLRELPVRW